MFWCPGCMPSIFKQLCLLFSVRSTGYSVVVRAIIFFMPTTQYTKRYGIYRTKLYGDVVPILKFISMSAEAQLKFPTMKVLKAIAKKLLVNTHEALYLAYNLSEGWAHQDVFFDENSREIRDIIFHRRPEEGYRSILAFLLLQTAAVKMVLNDNFRIYTAELESALPNFRPILAEFMERYPLKEPSPKDLNKVYQQVISADSVADYEDMVDNIMHLCPTYSIGKESEEASSCTNTFKKTTFAFKNFNTFKTMVTAESIEEEIKFELMSQRSELERPIMEENESRHTQFFRFETEA